MSVLLRHMGHRATEIQLKRLVAELGQGLRAAREAEDSKETQLALKAVIAFIDAVPGWEGLSQPLDWLVAWGDLDYEMTIDPERETDG